MLDAPLALDALGDPSRRQILMLLARGGMSVSGLLEHFDFSQPALSKHLRILREAGLVTFVKDGRAHRYELRGEAIRDAGAWMIELYAFWNDRLDTLGSTLDALAEEDAREDAVQ
ncbi:MAG: metalloregulator ArsR/SmtB family transcription factor [Planctomycetota bacterium]|nr:winged helix-turn-helix transcriptional regulator [Phycisphaerales bacterium]